MNKESSTRPLTTKETDTNKNNIRTTVAFTVSILVTIIVFVAGILFFKVVVDSDQKMMVQTKKNPKN